MDPVPNSENGSDASSEYVSDVGSGADSSVASGVGSEAGFFSREKFIDYI